MSTATFGLYQAIFMSVRDIRNLSADLYLSSQELPTSTTVRPPRFQCLISQIIGKVEIHVTGKRAYQLANQMSRRARPKLQMLSDI